VAIGPILMGVDKSAHILTPASTVRRVVNMTALAAVDAQLRGSGRTTAGTEAWRSMRQG
jgi:malate dehydrogenase (oxaloacetate-decarboxylating)(NADP+)